MISEYTKYLEETFKESRFDDLKSEEVINCLTKEVEKNDQKDIEDDPFIFIHPDAPDPIGRKSDCDDCEEGCEEDVDYESSEAAFKIAKNFYALILYNDNRMFFAEESGCGYEFEEAIEIINELITNQKKEKQDDE